MTDFSPSELRAHRMNVYARREGPAMTAEELAGKVGATKAQILAYENGHRVPDPKRVRALARALEVHPWYLMNLDRREEWSVADIRRSSALRAEDVVRQLSISPKNYRRFETEGIVPSRRPDFLSEVATVLGLSRDVVERALDQTPAVQRRKRRAAELVKTLADRYVTSRGPWHGPDPADADLVELATSYGRPISRMRRVLAYELGELRQRHVRFLREQVIADYDTDRERQRNARNALSYWEELYARELGRIPGRLELFHRTAQPSDAWEKLVDLYNADAVPRGDGPWAVTALVTEDNGLLPSHLVQQRYIEDVAVCRLTAAGFRHVSTFAGLYAALYPVVRKPLRTTTRSNRRSAAPPSLTFALPPQATAGGQSPQRLVVPTPALERLQNVSSGKAVNVVLSPRFRLTLHPNASGTVASAPLEADLPRQASFFEDDWFEGTNPDHRHP
ncbi:helix-turn-helix domain-containing protein [Streptomyces sp. NPDC003395]